MRAVIDLDDTICVHENRDYANAAPVLEVIQKIRAMKEAGWEIVIYSARGQISCNGDLERIEKKNRAVAEKWLEEHGVPYDELIFGKPIGDVYIDDRAMQAKDFPTAEIGLLHGGGSGQYVYRIGNVVKKDLGSHRNLRLFKDWVLENGGTCLYPKVISYLYDSVFMEYVDGPTLVDVCEWEDIEKLLHTIMRFRAMPKDEFTLRPQIDNLYENIDDDEEWNAILSRVGETLERHEAEIAEHASYCHGDFTLGNVIKAKDGLYLIDQRYFKESATYLYDLAKLRMSLLDYERRFGLSKKSNVHFLARYDEWLEGQEIRGLVVILTAMYICRTYRYKSEEQRAIVKEFVKEVMDGDPELFR